MSLHFSSFHRRGRYFVSLASARNLICFFCFICFFFLSCSFQFLQFPQGVFAFQLGNGLETVDLLEKKGRQFSTTRQWGKAQAVYRQVLQLREKEWGREDVRLIQPLNDVIRVTCVDGRCADTVPYLNRLLAIRLKKFGRQHADVATTYALIAEANEKMHRYPAALKNFGEAVKIRDLLYGKTDALAISSRVNMIRVFLKNNDKPAARKVMEECQALLKARGKPAPELDKVLFYYGEKF